MKRNMSAWAAYAASLFLAAGLVWTGGCEDDDESGANALVGRWRIVSETVPTGFVVDHTANGHVWIYDIKADGTIAVEDSIGSYATTGTARWTVSGGQVTIAYDNSMTPDMTYTYAINGSTLTMTSVAPTAGYVIALSRQ